MASSEPLQDSIERAKEAYKEFVALPAIQHAYLSQSHLPTKEKLSADSALDAQSIFSVNATWGQKNLLKQEEEKFKTCSQFMLAKNDVVQIDNPSLPTQTQALIESPSPSGKLQAVILPPSQPDSSSKKQFLQIYSPHACLQSFDLAKFHGNVSVGNLFSGLSWSQDEGILVYAAERKRKKSFSFFQDQPPTQKDESPPSPGHEYDFVENWGEQMVESSSPHVYILDRAKEEVKELAGLPEEYCFGQPLLADSNSVVCIGVLCEPWRLGLRFCYNRTGYIFHVAMDGSFCEKLGENGRLAMFPRFSPDRDCLIYLDHPSHGPHISNFRVMMIDWKTKQLTLVVESLDTPSPELSGIVCLSLPLNCFSADGSHLFLSCYNRSFQDVYSVSLQEHKTTQLTKDPGSWNLLDASHNLLLATYSSPNVTPRLMVGVFHEGTVTQWFQVSKPNTSAKFHELRWEVRRFAVSDTSEHIDAILVHPSDQAKEKKPPLAVYLHGGPHVPGPVQFFLWVSCIARLGFLCLFPNYRGTLGYSSSSIHSLSGKVGRQDVDDAQRTVDQLLSEGACDPERVVCIGGSHGGFIAAHLIGQFPKVYKASVMRNPVTNLASMAGVTDIPDWTYYESGLQHSQTTIMTGEALDSMLSKSPIIHAKEVQARVLILLGEKDCRVPNSQGLAYYKLLRALGKDVRILRYPNSNHSLREASVEADGFVNAVSFLLEAISS